MRGDPLKFWGYIEYEGEQYNFYADHFLFTFMTKMGFGPMMNLIQIKPENGFLHGYISGNRYIEIFVGKDGLRLPFDCAIRVPYYFVNRDCANPVRITSFNSIRFSGGTLKTLFRPEKVHFSPTREKNVYKGEELDDAIRSTFMLNNKPVKLCIESNVWETYTSVKHVLTNDGADFTLTFSEPQPIETWLLHYRVVMTLLSILTFRQNVRVESVFTSTAKEKQVPNMWGETDPQEEVDIYVDDHVTEETAKDPFYNISFKNVQDCLGNIMQALYERESGKQSYSFGFIPKDDEAARSITPEDVKAICAGLNFEFDSADLRYTEDPAALKNFKGEVLALLEKYSEGKNALSAGTRTLITGNVNRWGKSASEKYRRLYKIHQDELSDFLKRTDYEFTDEKLGIFLKYRNDVAHGTFRIEDRDVNNMAYILIGVIYCCFLSRMGLPSEKIKKLHGFEIIGS